MEGFSKMTVFYKETDVTSCGSVCWCSDKIIQVYGASPYKCLDVIPTHLCRVFFLSLVALVVFLKQQLHSAVSEISCCFPRLLEMHNYMASLKENLGGFSYHFANDTSQPKRDPKNNMNHQTRVSPGVFPNWSFNHDCPHVAWIKIQRQRVPRFHFHSATPMYREDSEWAIFLGALLRQATKSMLGTGRIRNRTFFLGGKDHFDPWPSKSCQAALLHAAGCCRQEKAQVVWKRIALPDIWLLYIYFYIFFWKELKEPTKLPSGNQQWLAGWSTI